MTVGANCENHEPPWEQLARGLPKTIKEFAAEVAGALSAHGYAYVKTSISPDHCQMLAAETGTLMLRYDVKIDKQRELGLKEKRVVKDRPGPYGSAAFAFHTDNVRVDVVSFYCVEQDDVDGASLLLDLDDVADHFEPDELETLTRLYLWAPFVAAPGVDKENFSHLAPLLSKHATGYRVYYIPWLLREPYEPGESEVLDKFACYVREKSDTQTIRVPFQKGESVFIDNHRMLHGRAAISQDSKRHLIRFYLSVPSMSCRSVIREIQPNG